MTRKDLILVTVIGAAVGLLAQPILSNFTQEIHGVVQAPYGVIRTGVFVCFLLLAPIALSVASVIGRKVPVLYQFAKFAAVGSLNSFVDLGVFNLITLLWGGVPQALLFSVFKGASFLAATTNSFVWNKYWTFGSAERPDAGQVVKFYTIAIIGGVVNVGAATAMKAFGDSAGFPENLWGNIVAPIAGIFTALLWNFLGYKYFVFKKSAGLPMVIPPKGIDR
ncbi:GtrA family protein [Candidatus Parcubacteria bacterium]|nr:MAG: GtrA family protein [Candidatus Parcubacteria bacterium]